MDKDEYIKIIKDSWIYIMNSLDTLYSEEKLNEIFIESLEILENKDNSIEDMYLAAIDKYIKIILEVNKLCPGIAVGLKDLNYNIVLNTYNGKVSDRPNEKDLDDSYVFDASSMTKLFTVILLLKEEEKGNIDLNKKFNDYSNLIPNVGVSVIDALRFGVELRTRGRLDEIGIDIEERKKRLKETYIYKDNTFKYSDIPYMLVPLIFGDTLEEASENYLKIFYKLYRGIGLSKTGYSTINMTGGRINHKNGQVIFDPKARIFETQIGYVSGHAGVTTTIEDLEKLFKLLKNGLLNESSLEKLITQAHPKGNRATGVYINKGDITESDISAGFSKKSFAISGSTGTYAVFDIDNGLMTCFLSNIKSGISSKIINTGDIYTFGDDKTKLPQNYNAKLISGTGTIRDGRLINEDGSEMTFAYATNSFKDESFKTLIKLRFIKEVLIRKAIVECPDDIEKCLNKIEETFNGNSIKENGKSYKLRG